MKTLIDAWTSVNQAGSGVFPYLGVAMVCIIVLFCLGLILYVSYRLLKRLPPTFSYLGWVIKYLFIRVTGRISRTSAPSSDSKIRLGTSGSSRPLKQFFTKKVMAADITKPLVVLLSMGSNADTAIELAMGLTSQPDEGTCATWWSLSDKAVLQIHLDSLGRDTSLVVRLATLLRQARNEPPVGLVVNLALRQPEADALPSVTMQTLQHALRALGEHIGYQLPLWVTITSTISPCGVAQTSRILGAKQLAALMRWEATSLDDRFNPVELERGAERTLKALVVALAHDEHVDNISVRDRSRALRLPQSWSQLSDLLMLFRPPEHATAEAIESFPRLQALDLLVPAAPASALAPTQATPVYSERAPWARQHHTRPLASARRERQRSQQVLKSTASAVGLTIVTLSAVTITSQTIDSDARLLSMAASRIAQVSTDAQDAYANADTERAEASTRQVIEVLRSIQEASQASAANVAVPRSWLGGPRARLQDRQGEILRRQIVAPRVRTLAEAIKNEELPSSELTLLLPHTLQDLPSFVSFRGIIERRRMTLMSIDTARELGDAASYQSILTLLDKQAAANSLHGVDLRDSLPPRVREQLHLNEVFDEIVQKDVQDIAPNAWEKVLEEALDRHPLLVDAETIEKTLEGMARGREPNDSETAEVARLLQRIRIGVQARDARRLLGKPSDTAAFFSGGLSSLMRAGGFSVSQMSQATEATQRHREHARSKLLTMGLPGDVRMFIEGPDGRITLTPDFARLASAWSAMNAQPFMRLTTEMTSSVPDHADGWDLARLQPLKSLQTSLSEFLDTGLSAFEPSLRPTLRRMASQRSRLVSRSILLDSALTDSGRLEHHTSLDPLASLRLHIANIVTAASLYRQTLARDEQFHDDDPAAALLRRSAQRQLVRLQGALTADDPYASIVRDVGHWMKNSQGALAMATTLGGQPKERLTMARAYIVSQYAENATPLLEVAMLGSPSAVGRHPDVQRWQRFIDTIEGFDKGATSNGLAEFEQYLLSLGKLGRPEDCERFLADWPIAVRRSDHFSQQLTELEQTVATACEERSEGVRRKAYESFAHWFNIEIANRFPFGPPSSDALSRAQLLSVLERYAQLRVQTGNPRNWTQPVTEFIREMDALFAQFVGRFPTTASSFASPAEKASEGVAKAIGVSSQGFRSDGTLVTQPVRFHVRLRGQEDDSELVKHIIDVGVTVAERTVGLRSASTAHEWRPGEPIEVRLRWAADSSYAPVGDASSSYKVSGRTAIFSFSGDWALSLLLDSTSSRQALRETLVPLPVTIVGGRGRLEADFQLRLVDGNGSPFRMTFPKRAPLLSLGEQTTPSLRIRKVDAP